MGPIFKKVAVVVLAAFALSGLAIFLQASYYAITLQVSVFIIAFAWLFIWLIKEAGSVGRRLEWILLALVLFYPYLLVTSAGASHVINSLRLERFTGQFLSNPPEDSTLSLVQAQVGVLTGNGNHCDFIVDIEIASRLSRDEIAAHYAELPVRRAIAGESSQILLDVQRVGEGVFMLNVTDAPNGAALDFRCH